ncbi:unnamed protein product [Rotaria sp. Silwood1]|nr:unnamed protein product [Rotaria sp. Silwood1]CAF1633473.1 unnamed protein product [Rotaria sp. Silwood1]
MDITQKIDPQMLKNVTYKKLLPFMMLSVCFSTRDLLCYAQLSYDTILISIKSNTKLPLTVNSLFPSHGLDLTSSLQILIDELYVRYLERLLIIGQYLKNDIWCLYEIRARIYTLLQRSK